jgi:single-strand DNA-binding protein
MHRKDAEGHASERPHFFDVTVYGASAESVARYTQKGSRIGVDGRLEWREWETDEKERRQAVSIVADVVQFLDGPPGRRGDGDGDEGGDAIAGAERELVGVGAEELDVTF